MPPKRRGSRSTAAATSRGRSKKPQSQIHQDYFRSTRPRNASSSTTGKQGQPTGTGHSYIATGARGKSAPAPPASAITDADIERLDRIVTDAWPAGLERTLVHRDESVTTAERLLRQFDLTLRFGPCIGISRAERWQRAASHDLHPPAYLAELLDDSAVEWRRLRGVQEKANIDRNT
ncbi:hypothetical protein SYNPS1DRAFT_30817 [Syncephalis pseudoplumigaleata]|uniref:DNA polymerase delta, subunit 4-domain-containing protein n=1 Tax=Syncephalis pseudoplumigaleata TaxID=1712513 RepID=A0A4P9YU10_9FUNG|nr:hypothetical protein SYNPS1DRAFT_30817 [Syncephalis pseudoplumigaleata]|eukprot:RKP23436.1 hypothetical protein SYNPS1DRAFT_30817 [Syncephalis pseudoplumigaleata]